MTHLIENAALALMLIAAVFTHMAPSLMAFEQKHSRRLLILAVNVIPGVGFLLALILVMWSGLELRREMAALKSS